MTATELRERIRKGHQELYPTGCHDPRCSDCRPTRQHAWKRQPTNQAQTLIVDAFDDSLIAIVPDSRLREAESGGDSYLIAAAPDMLEALKDALRLIDMQGQPRICGILQAAVARAEGR